MNSLTRIALLIGALGIVLATLAWWQWPDGRLHIFFLETPGDAVLVQTPQRGFVLIDGGADPTALATLLGRRLPFWQRDLDAVVLTLPDAQRLPGQLAALTRYHAGMALAPTALPRNASVQEWQRLLAAQNTPIRIARLGQRIPLGGTTLTVVALDNGDETGLVLRLDYGHTSVLLDGAGDPDDPQLTQAPRALNALALPWERPLPDTLLAATRPRTLVFTDGYQSKHPALLTTLDRAVGSASVYHERLNGTIELISDGSQMTVHTEKD